MNIIMLGDSLIEYYDWQRRFPGHRVWNLGIAGESVEGLLSRVMRIQGICPEADCICIMSGINNVAMGDVDFIDFYKVVLEKLSSFYRTSRIFVHSLLPSTAGFISDTSIREVNDSLRALARDSGAEYLDVYGRFVDTKGRPVREYLLDDGVHVSSAGYEVWSAMIEAAINDRQG
jgi:lysophospholipase L1-like esterase